MTVLLACMACGSTAAPPPVPPPQPAPVTTTTPPAGSLAERGLAFVQRLRTAEDLAPAKIEAAFGLGGVDPAHPDRYAAGRALDATWIYNVETLDPTRLRISFEDQTNASADMTAVCTPDFEAHRAALTAAGFTAQEWLGEHQRRLGWWFTRESTRITLEVRGESDARVDHPCVSAIDVTVAAR